MSFLHAQNNLSKGAGIQFNKSCKHEMCVFGCVCVSKREWDYVILGLITQQ